MLVKYLIINLPTFRKKIKKVFFLKFLNRNFRSRLEYDLHLTSHKYSKYLNLTSQRAKVMTSTKVVRSLGKNLLRKAVQVSLEKQRKQIKEQSKSDRMFAD